MGIVLVRAASFWMKAACRSWGGCKISLESHRGWVMTSMFPKPVLCWDCTGRAGPVAYQALSIVLAG